MLESNSTEASDAQSCIYMPMECTSFVNDTQPCRCIPTEWNSTDSLNTQLCDCLMEFNLTDSTSSEWSDSQMCCESLTRTKQDVVRSFPINFLVLAPFPDEDFKPTFDQGHSIIPAVQLAAEQINNRTDILDPLFYINILIGDSGCDKASKIALNMVSVLTDLLNNSGNFPLGIIGPACSEDSIFVVNAVNRFGAFNRRFDIPALYSGTTPKLRDERSNKAFGMISSAAILTDILIRVATKENWDLENIAVLYEDSRERFQDTYDALIRGLNGSQQVGYTRQITLSQIPLDEINNRNIRVVVVFSGKKLAYQLVCLAGQPKVNFVFPIHQLIFTERSLEDFLTVNEMEFSFIQQSNGKRYHCDRETMIRGLNGSIFLNQALDSVDPDVVTVSNYTAGQVKQQYKTKLAEYGKIMNLTLSESSYAYPYYDATWALALGWHNGLPAGSDFDIYSEILNNVKFQGVSNWIDFSNSRHVSKPVSILQAVGTSAVEKGLLNGSKLIYASETFIGDELKTENVVLHLSLAALGLLFVVVLLVFTVIIQVMMVVYQDYPSVKASSARLNHFIYLGCYLFIVAIVANTLRQVLPTANGLILCNVDIVSSMLASCFIFSAILAKSWRTYRIFNDVFKSRSHYSLHDATLSTLILILAFVQVLLFIPTLVVSPFKEVTSFDYDNSQWPPVRKLKSVCTTQSVGYLAFPLLFQLCLIFTTIVLATLNRTIKRRNFRTTKQIIMLVYMLAIIWAAGGPLLVLFYHLDFSVNITYSFYSCLLVVTVLLCQFMLIVPFLLPVLSGDKLSGLNSHYHSDRRPSTQLSVLFDRRLSLPKFAHRRTSTDSQSNHRSSLQILAHRRSSLQTYSKSQLPPLRTHTSHVSFHRSSSEGQAYLQMSCTSLQSVSESHASSLSRTTLQSIPESVESTKCNSPLQTIVESCSELL